MIGTATIKFTANTRYVGSTPYCANTGKAVWVKIAREVGAVAAIATFDGFKSAYDSTKMAYTEAAFEANGIRASVIGMGGQYQMVAANADGRGIHAVIGCECHAREIAQHVTTLAL